MATGKDAREAEILLVEDNPGDIRLTMEALRSGRILAKLNVVMDGEEALDYLYRRGRFHNAPRPDLILLDLNLPKLDGRQVLKEIKADNNLKRIPVVILTTSRDDQDIVKSYDLNANAYITKPLDLNQFVKAIKIIEDFWLTLVKLPQY